MKAVPQTSRRPTGATGRKTKPKRHRLLKAAITGISLGIAIWVFHSVQPQLRLLGITNTPSQHATASANKLVTNSLEDPAFPQSQSPANTTATDSNNSSQPPAAADSPQESASNSYEKTTLTVQRILITQKRGEARTKKDNTLNIPVVYNTHLLGLTPDDVHKTYQIVTKLKDIRNKIAELQVQEQEALRTWQEIHRRSLPYEILMADSPSLNPNEKLKEPQPTGHGVNAATPSNTPALTNSPDGIE